MEGRENFDAVSQIRCRLVFAALHGDFDSLATSLQEPRIIDAKARRQKMARDDNGLPRASRDPYADTLADEIVAEARNGRVRHDMAIVDLGIDELDGAKARTVQAKFVAVQANGIASLHITSMAFGDFKPENEVLLGNCRHRVTAHDDGSRSDGDSNHASRGRGHGFTF